MRIIELENGMFRGMFFPISRVNLKKKKKEKTEELLKKKKRKGKWQVHAVNQKRTPFRQRSTVAPKREYKM